MGDVPKIPTEWTNTERWVWKRLPGTESRGLIDVEGLEAKFGQRVPYLTIWVMIDVKTQNIACESKC